MTDSSPSDSDISKDDGPKKEKESPEVNADPNKLRDKADLLNWLDESINEVRRSRQGQPVNRRRTTIHHVPVDDDVKRELADILGKGQWVEVPTPEQLNCQIQSMTPAALKFLIDLVTPSTESITETIPSTSSPPASSPSVTTSSPDGSTPTNRPPRAESSLTPEMVALKRLIENRRLFVNPAREQVETEILKFSVIVVIVFIILIHMFMALIDF